MGIVARWNDKSDGLGAMKQAQVFLSQKEFSNWYRSNHNDVKYLTVIPSSALKKAKKEV